MSLNIADFSRYLKDDRGVYLQIVWLPAIKLMFGFFAIICTSASRVVYGQYIWDPATLSARWTDPGGRALCFFFNIGWIIAQMAANLSSNVVTSANDFTSIFPKYINIRRGVVLSTVVGCWCLQPWKIIASAGSLLTFMSGLGVFLAPLAAIVGADYWVVHRQRYDVPALYKAYGRYRYGKLGVNWRALVAFCVGCGPAIPGL